MELFRIKDLPRYKKFQRKTPLTRYDSGVGESLC
jgi:hypothetical protein